MMYNSQLLFILPGFEDSYTFGKQMQKLLGYNSPAPASAPDEGSGASRLIGFRWIGQRYYLRRCIYRSVSPQTETETQLSYNNLHVIFNL